MKDLNRNELNWCNQLHLSVLSYILYTTIYLYLCSSNKVRTTAISMAIRIPKQIPTIIPVDAEKIYKHITIHTNYRLLLAYLKSSLKCFTHIQDKNTFSINTKWSLFGSQVVIPKHTQNEIISLQDCFIAWLLDSLLVAILTSGK